MTERRRQIKNRDDEKLLYDVVFSDEKHQHNKTHMATRELRIIKSLKKTGVIREH